MSSGSQTFLVQKSNGQLHIRLDWWSRFDIGGNYSDVTVTATIIRGAHGYNTNSTSDLSQLFINGQLFESRHHIGGTNHSQNEIARATHRVQHSEDGTKIIEIGFKHWFNVWFNSQKIGEQTFIMSNQRLDDIPRLSDFTVQDTIIMGTSATIYIAPKANIFDHRIRFRWGNRNDMINDYVDKTIRQQVWTPTINYANDIPSATSSWGTLVVETWLNGVYIGERTKAITLIVPDNIKPTLSSVTLTDMNNIVKTILNTSNHFIQSKSNIKVTYNNAVGAYGSNIVGYRSEIVNTPHYADGNGSLLGVMYMSGNYILKSYVIDSRGRQSEPRTTPIKILEYHAPIGNFIVSRGGENKDKAIATINCKVAPLRIGSINKNKLKIKIYSSLSGGSFVLDTEKTTTSILEYINQELTMKKTYEPNRTYSFKFEVWDRFTELENVTHTVAIDTLEAEAIPFALHPNGFMVNTTEIKGAANIKGDMYVDGQVNITGTLTAFNKAIQTHALTQKSGEAIEAINVDFNTHRKMGYYWKNNTCANSPNNNHGWLEVFANGNDILQRFYSTDMRVFHRLMWAGDRRWREWIEIAPHFLTGKNNKWYYVECPKGQNLGDFLKSDKVPICPLVTVRDGNTFANIWVTKESAMWIYGLAVRHGRLDTVNVEGGVYKGYRGWTLP